MISAVTTNAPNSHRWCSFQAATSSASFDQKPASGNTPARASEPSSIVQNVIGMFFRSPPISLMLFECTAWITEPAPRNSRALKNAWVNRWKNPAVRPALPIESPAIM